MGKGYKQTIHRKLKHVKFISLGSYKGSASWYEIALQKNKISKILIIEEEMEKLELYYVAGIKTLMSNLAYLAQLKRHIPMLQKFSSRHNTQRTNSHMSKKCTRMYTETLCEQQTFRSKVKFVTKKMNNYIQWDTRK